MSRALVHHVLYRNILVGQSISWRYIVQRTLDAVAGALTGDAHQTESLKAHAPKLRRNELRVFERWSLFMCTLADCVEK